MLAFGLFLVRALTVLFFVGLVGSAVVVLISFAEDFQELFSPDEPAEPKRPPPAQLTR